MKAAVEFTIAHVMMLGDTFNGGSSLICSVTCRAYKDTNRVSYQIIDDEGEPISEEYFITDDTTSEDTCKAAIEDAKATLKDCGWFRVSAYIG